MEASQLAIYQLWSHSWTQDSKVQVQLGLGQGLNWGPSDYKSSTLTLRKFIIYESLHVTLMSWPLLYI